MGVSSVAKINVFKSATIVAFTPKKREETKRKRDMTLGFPKEARQFHERSNLKPKSKGCSNETESI